MWPPRPGLPLPYNAVMRLERKKVYRAVTAAGRQITFTVLDPGDGVWITADLDSPEGPEPKVLLNTGLLLWISSETRGAAISKATEDVIEALEETGEEPV